MSTVYIVQRGGGGVGVLGVAGILVCCLVVVSLSLSLSSRLSPYQRSAALLSISESGWLLLTSLLLRSWTCRIAVNKNKGGGGIDS